MEWTKLTVRFVRSMEYTSASDAACRAWVGLVAYCADQENGGTIELWSGAAEESLVQAAGITARGLAEVISCRLATKDGVFLMVHGYDPTGDKAVASSRRNGHLGGRPRKEPAGLFDRKPGGFEKVKPIREEERRREEIEPPPSEVAHKPGGFDTPDGAIRPAPAKPPSLHDELLGAFCATWRAANGRTYAPTAKDRSQLGRLLGQLGKTSPDLAPQLPDLFERYLADADPFVAQDQGHSLAYFCTSGGVNKYRVDRPALSEREARTKRAAERFVGRTGVGNARR